MLAVQIKRPAEAAGRPQPRNIRVGDARVICYYRFVFSVSGRAFIMKKLFALCALFLLASCTEGVEPLSGGGPIGLATWDSFNWDEAVWQ